MLQTLQADVLEDGNEQHLIAGENIYFIKYYYNFIIL